MEGEHKIRDQVREESYSQHAEKTDNIRRREFVISLVVNDALESLEIEGGALAVQDADWLTPVTALTPGLTSVTGLIYQG